MCRFYDTERREKEKDLTYIQRIIGENVDASHLYVTRHRIYSSDQKVIGWVLNPDPLWALRFHVVSVPIGRHSPLSYPYFHQLPAPLQRGNRWLFMLLYLLLQISSEEVGVTVVGKELRLIYSLCQALRLHPAAVL
jgi:hypothetical protein